MSVSQGDCKLHEDRTSRLLIKGQLLWAGAAWTSILGGGREGLYWWETPSRGLMAKGDTSAFKIPTSFKYMPTKM